MRLTKIIERIGLSFWLCGLLMAAGCAATDKPQQVNLATPESAAIEYVKALQRGDAATARFIAKGTQEQMRWVDALAALVDGMRKLNEAMYNNFGRYTAQIHTDLEDSLRILADEPVVLISNGSIQRTATEATIYPQRQGISFTSRDQVPISVVKQPNKEIWNVDLEQTYVPLPEREKLMTMNVQQRQDYAADQRKVITAAMKKYQQTADIFHGVARDVQNKRLKSIPEVEKALGERMADIRVDGQR
jgi:hypothetical protein